MKNSHKILQKAISLLSVQSFRCIKHTDAGELHCSHNALPRSRLTEVWLPLGTLTMEDWWSALLKDTTAWAGVQNRWTLMSWHTVALFKLSCVFLSPLCLKGLWATDSGMYKRDGGNWWRRWKECVTGGSNLEPTPASFGPAAAFALCRAGGGFHGAERCPGYAGTLHTQQPRLLQKSKIYSALGGHSQNLCVNQNLSQSKLICF